MKKTYLIIVLNSIDCELMFVHGVVFISRNSLTFMRYLAHMFDDKDEAFRVAHLYESCSCFSSNYSFHVVENTNLW